jgi:hypothetical protein
MAVQGMTLNQLAKYRVTPYALNQQAGAQQGISTLAKDQPGVEMDAERMSTFLPVESRPDLPPNMRMWTRWQYLDEYIHYWRWGLITKALAIVLLIVGVLMIPFFVPGALLTLAVSARLGSLSWMYNFIVWTFGKYRTLVLVD